MMMRGCGKLVLAVVAVLSAAPVIAETQSEDLLEIYAFVGNNINNFSANSRKDYINRDEANDSDIEFMAGLEFYYLLWEGDRQDGTLYGQFIHSSRVLEASCEDSSSSDCQSQANPEDFFEIIKDSDVLEWLGGVKWSWRYGEMDPREGIRKKAIFVKVQGGFLRAEAAPDDVIDNHFAGIGVERTTGKFAGSHVQAGVGRTDLFSAESRSNRAKLGAVLHFWPGRNRAAGGGAADKESYAGFFFEGWLDSDLGPASDDIQIDYGVFFDVDAIFQKLTE